MVNYIRRVVTGHNADGKSCIARDGNATSILEAEAVPGLVCHDFWETTATPADNTGDQDAADRPVHLEPPANGSIFRIVDFPPDASWQDNLEGVRESFEAMDAGHASDGDSDDPMMHKTPSVDYAIVLEGEIWAVMEKARPASKPVRSWSSAAPTIPGASALTNRPASPLSWWGRIRSKI